MKNIKVGLYTRVSTQEQASEGYSIGEQKIRLEKYSDAQDWLVYKLYSDPGFSGGSTNRPGLKSLIQDVKAGKLDKVVVYKLDRLSRSQKDTLYLIEDVFLKNNVDFVSMTENFDTSTPFGRAMIGILSVFAQLEREQIKERMQVGLDARAKAGYYHGGPYAPIGYEYVDGELIINEYEAIQVRKIYELYLDNMPVHSIFKYMESRYKQKYGNWTDSSVRSVINSLIYSGRIEWKNEVYKGRHEPIIDEDMFIKIQNEKARRKKENAEQGKKAFKRTTLLAGLLWCGCCGARYYCKQNSTKKPGITPAQKYYTCYSRGKSSKTMIKDPNCKNKSYNIKVLDKIILDELEKFATNIDYVLDVKEKSNTNNNDNKKEVLENRLKEIDKQLNKLVDLYMIDTIDFDTINKKIEKLTSEKNNIQGELFNLEEVKPELSIEEAKIIIKELPAVLERSDEEDLKKIIHSLIDAIIINGEDLVIHWKFT